LGLLRFSRLTAELADDDLEPVGQALLGGSFSRPTPWSPRAKGEVALALFNHFLDKYQVATRTPDVRPVGRWDLAHLHFDDGQSSGDLSPNGGGITLAVVGLPPGAHRRMLQALAMPDAPAAYERAVLAIRVPDTHRD
jgi:hypothetical protein